MDKVRPLEKNARERAGAATGQNTLLAARHLLIGWVGLLVFLILGILLETLHGLKIDLYVDLRNEPRRLMWRLAHAHGTLFSLVNMAFAWTVVQLHADRWLSRASWLLVAALIILPAGFFGGGIWLSGGDPGPLVFAVPVGATCALIGVAATIIVLARNERRFDR